IQSSITFSFFVSSRRRHTRSKRDWSSDVCSSDLELPDMAGDYVVTPVAKGSKLSFENKDIWKNTEAVKNGHTIKVDEGIYWLNDPYSLEYERKDLKEQLLKQ